MRVIAVLRPYLRIPVVVVWDQLLLIEGPYDVKRRRVAVFVPVSCDDIEEIAFYLLDSRRQSGRGRGRRMYSVQEEVGIHS